MTGHASTSRVQRYVVWEWWEHRRAWEPMTLPLTMDDAIDMAALSDAGTCRILPAGDHIEPDPRDA